MGFNPIKIIRNVLRPIVSSPIGRIALTAAVVYGTGGIGIVAGAITNVAVQGLANVIDDKKFFDGWQTSAITGGAGAYFAGASGTAYGMPNDALFGPTGLISQTPSTVPLNIPSAGNVTDLGSISPPIGKSLIAPPELTAPTLTPPTLTPPVVNTSYLDKAQGLLSKGTDWVQANPIPAMLGTQMAMSGFAAMNKPDPIQPAPPPDYSTVGSGLLPAQVLPYGQQVLPTGQQVLPYDPWAAYNAMIQGVRNAKTA